MNYFERFLKLKCSGDVMNVYAPFANFEKEIVAAWAVIRKIKGIILKNPGKYNITDISAGNAFISVMASFLLPISKAIAIDDAPKKRRHDTVNKFEYVCISEFMKGFRINSIKKYIDENTILVSSNIRKHDWELVDIFTESPIAKAICFIPSKNIDLEFIRSDQFLFNKLCPYDLWCHRLEEECVYDAMNDMDSSLTEEPQIPVPWEIGENANVLFVVRD